MPRGRTRIACLAHLFVAADLIVSANASDASAQVAVFPRLHLIPAVDRVVACVACDFILGFAGAAICVVVAHGAALRNGCCAAVEVLEHRLGLGVAARAALAAG